MVNATFNFRKEFRIELYRGYSILNTHQESAARAILPELMAFRPSFYGSASIHDFFRGQQ
ncbi:hypothetical protein CSA37_12445 [Candidatus Fermentibacteria bacterium]|nr:MAG: hypothetical protein CSA37_12445 [Candidatus Fermentibacteria bacterium]